LFASNYRFKPYKGNLKANDNKTKSLRRDAVRAELKAGGEEVEE